MPKLLIIASAGHGGGDPGGQSNGLVEKHLNLNQAHEFNKFMHQNYDDCVVKIVRSGDFTLSSKERLDIIDAIIASNKNEYDMFLVIDFHHNMFNGKARGAEVIDGYYNHNDNMLAQRILDNFKKSGQAIRRRFSKLNSRKSDFYYMIRNYQETRWPSLDITSIIVESGFLDNAADAKWLQIIDPQKKAWIVGEAVAWFYDLPKTTKTDYENHWAKNWINQGIKAGLFAPADEFRPEDDVTRAELAVVAVKLSRKADGKES